MISMNRRHLLQYSVGGIAIGALGSLAPNFSAAQTTNLRLWLQAQWWDPKYADACEKTTGVRVQNTTTPNNPTTFSKLQAGGGKDVDVVQISNAFVTPLANQGLLQPINLDLVPNARHLFAPFAKPDYVMGDDGKQYGVPFVWGYDSLLYNADHVSETDTFKSLFDDKYRGKIGLRDDAYYSMAVAATAMGVRDPFAMSRAELNEVKTFLVSKKPLIRTLWSSFSEVVNLMKSRDMWLTQGWLPMYWVLSRSEKMNVKYPIPREGAPGWVGIFIIPRETRQVEAAHKFINWMLSDEWGAPIAIDKGYYSSTRLALPKLPEDIKALLGYDQIEQQMQRLIWTKFPANLQEWTEAWTEFKAA
jgi:spermidine/putrescine-binding protein